MKNMKNTKNIENIGLGWGLGKPQLHWLHRFQTPYNGNPDRFFLLLAGLPELVYTPRTYLRVAYFHVFVYSLFMGCMFEV